MAGRRERKRHVQVELPKFDKNGQRRGGKRKNAGRKPPKGKRSSERHKIRPDLSGREPILVTMRILRAVGNLRRRHYYRAIRLALLATAQRDDFRIVHFSIQNNHLHLIVEAESKAALSRGMKGFAISAAKHINAEIVDEHGERRRGQVFADRYHARVITSPRQCRNALSYVLRGSTRIRSSRPAEPIFCLTPPRTRLLQRETAFVATQSSMREQFARCIPPVERDYLAELKRQVHAG